MTAMARVGLVGSGFAAGFHCRAYERIRDIDVRLVGVAASTRASAEAFAAEHGIAAAHGGAEELIARADVDIIDLCVPNRLHEPLAMAAIAAGKHVICEKPLTGYFGGSGAAQPVGATPRALMYAQAVASAERMVRAARAQGVRLLYAENWLHSPAVVKANRLAAASGGTILEVRGQECHSGSHAAYARRWELSGGGSLLRLGSHPLCAALWLKREEGLRRAGQPITARSVTAEVADLSRVPSVRDESQHWLVDGWHDVENWSSVLITFSDGTRAVILASDIVLGGMDDSLTLMMSNGRVDCKLTLNNALMAFAPNDEVFGDEYLLEKSSTKAGWSHVSVDEEYLLGYPQEIRDCVESVVYERPARAEGELGLEVVKVIYAAYRSAEEGRRISLD
ncbi:MAG: Gfo/Idh/MocA family oxidoreductase [Chloroflexi bacterium]|nr:Gfo/Idh/MocA family oxidoreductase [Chloroflexota bacterium]